MSDPVTEALQRLDADLAAVAEMTNQQERAQARADAEQRWLNAAQTHIEGS